MGLAGSAACEGHNRHPEHVAFVEGRRMPEVADFFEIDTEPLG